MFAKIITCQPEYVRPHTRIAMAWLTAAKSAASSVKLRTRFAKLTQDLRQENDYSSQLIESKMSGKLNEAIFREMEKHMQAMI